MDAGSHHHVVAAADAVAVVDGIEEHLQTGQGVEQLLLLEAVAALVHRQRASVTTLAVVVAVEEVDLPPAVGLAEVECHESATVAVQHRPSRFSGLAVVVMVLVLVLMVVLALAPVLVVCAAAAVAVAVAPAAVPQQSLSARPAEGWRHCTLIQHQVATLRQLECPSRLYYALTQRRRHQRRHGHVHPHSHPSEHRQLPPHSELPPAPRQQTRTLPEPHQLARPPAPPQHLLHSLG